jgi:hypothetical protein
LKKGEYDSEKSYLEYGYGDPSEEKISLPLLLAIYPYEEYEILSCNLNLGLFCRKLKWFSQNKKRGNFFLFYSFEHQIHDYQVGKRRAKRVASLSRPLTQRKRRESPFLLVDIDYGGQKQ